MVYCHIHFKFLHNIQKAGRDKIARKLEEVRKNHERLEKNLIQPNGKLMDSDREEIVKMPIRQLLQQLKDGQLTCVQVLRAYQAKVL